MEAVFHTDEEYREILQRLEELMKEAEQLPYPNVKELVTSILQYFDLIHREPLARLMKTIESNQPELKASLENDDTVKTLFSLYDLMEGDIESSPLDNPKTMGFVPVAEVGLLSKPLKREREE